MLMAVARTSICFAQDGADAEALFNEAKRDVEAGRLEVACPKFQRAFEGSGVTGALLSWADCEEKRGRLLEARELWRRGAVESASDPERAQFVSVRLAELDQRIAREGTTQTVPVNPPLVTAPPKPATLKPAPPKPAPDAGAGLRLAGWIIGGMGVVSGLAFLGTAISVATECSNWTCPAEVQPTLVANAVAGGVGVVALGVGAILLGVGFARDEHDQPRLRVTGVGDLGIGLSLEI